MAELEIKDLVRAYGAVQAVKGVTLTVADGEFLTLLGPSGCGKSTTLFCVSGLDSPTSGTIRLGDQVLFGGGVSVPPERRDIGLVFQSYALWPHMTVTENLAFPLKIRKLPAKVQKERIAEALSLVELDAYAQRYPFELSGGQQQRVALARALVYQPRLLLLDEPLSNLDAKLRERARVWLREIQQRLKVTTIYVTHDQAEALAISDRIAVLQGGEIMQLGTPHEVYESPRDSFVADFIGSSNFLDGEIVGREGDLALVRLSEGDVLRSASDGLPVGATVQLAVKPERLAFADAPGENILPVRIHEQSYLGSIYQCEVTYGKGVRIRVQSDRRYSSGDQAHLVVPPGATKLFLR